MSSACQSALRNLTPRPCIHRPLFLEADGRIGIQNVILITHSIRIVCRMSGIRIKWCNNVELLVIPSVETTISLSSFCVHKYYIKVLYIYSCFTVPLVNLLKRGIKSGEICPRLQCLCASLSKKQQEEYRRFTSIGSTLESSFTVYLKIDSIGERGIYKKMYKYIQERWTVKTPS